MHTDLVTHSAAVGTKRKAPEPPHEERPPTSDMTGSAARGVSPLSEAATTEAVNAPQCDVQQPPPAQSSTVDALCSIVLEAVRRNREQRQELMQQMMVENGVLLELLARLRAAGGAQQLETQLVSLLSAIPQVM